MKSRVAMLVTNDVANDSRVKKEAKALSSAGYDVTIFAVASPSFQPGTHWIEGIEVRHLSILQTRVRRNRDWGPIQVFARRVGVLLFWPFVALRRVVSKIGKRLRNRKALKKKWGPAPTASSMLEAFRRFLPAPLHFLVRPVAATARPVVVVLRKIARRTRAIGRGGAALRTKFKDFMKSLKGANADLSVTNLLPRIGRLANNVAMKLSARGKRVVKTFLGGRYARHALSLAYARAATPEVIRLSPDVIHCHDFDTAVLGQKLALKTGAKLVYDSHELWSERNVPHPRSLGSRLMRSYELAKERRVLNEADLVITVGDGIRKRLEGLGAPNDRTLTIKNIPDFHELGDFVGDETQTDTHNVYYSGRITTGRLLEVLIAAVATIHGSRWVVNLLGYGPQAYLDALQKQANDAGVSLMVHQAVPSSDVPRTLRQGDCIFVGVEPVVESYRLALPNKFFEALMSGRPVVIPALPEIEAQATGLDGIYTFRDFTPEAVAQTLQRAVAQPLDICGALTERSERFSWEQEAAKLIIAYSEITSPRQVREGR